MTANSRATLMHWACVTPRKLNSCNKNNGKSVPVFCKSSFVNKMTVLKSCIIWGTTSGSLFKDKWRFGGTYLCLPPASCWFLAWLILRTRRGKHHVPLKHQLTFNGLHSVISTEDSALHNHRCENLRSYKMSVLFIQCIFLELLIAYLKEGTSNEIRQF
jgi:hypothetical protein